MKRTAIAVSVCFGIAPSGAFALDWSIKATESETVEVNSNQFLRTPPAASVGSYTTLTVNAEARTPTSKFDFDADGNYKKYWGPGVDGLPSESVNYGFKARYEGTEKTKNDREFIETSWRQQSTSLALLNDLGIATPTRGYLDKLTATGGIDRSISARDSLSLLATSTRTSYEPSSGGTPLTDTIARGIWRHNLSSITSLNISSEAELLDIDNTFSTSIEIYRNQIGIQATLSPVLSFRGNIGAVYLTTDRGVSTTGGLTTPISSSDLDWIGDAVLTYQLLKKTTLALTASQSIGPSVVGSLFKRDTIGASINHVINGSSTLSLSATGNRLISTTTTDFVMAAATYTYTLTREWTAQLTYRYQHRFASSGTATLDPITNTPTASGSGPADSHGIMLVVSHHQTLLPSGQ